MSQHTHTHIYILFPNDFGYFVVNRTLRNKSQWNWCLSTTSFCKKKCIWKCLCIVAAISSRSPCGKQTYAILKQCMASVQWKMLSFVSPGQFQCLASCAGQVAGTYHHVCTNCNTYINCGLEERTTEQACGPNLQWDNKAYSCVQQSTTCNQELSKCS